MTEYTPTVEEWIAANTVPCAANGEEHDCSYEYLYVEVETARAFLAAVERAAAVKALREAKAVADRAAEDAEERRNAVPAIAEYWQGYARGAWTVGARLKRRADRIESGEQA